MGAQLKKEIAKCPAEHCSIKEACTRFTMKPGERQLYFMESPVEPGSFSCLFFIHNGKPVPKETDLVKKQARKRSIYR